MKQKILVSMMAIFVALGVCSAARGQEKPLTKDQVLTLVRNQMGDEAGAKTVEARGIDFEPSEDFLSSLKKAGANDAFLQALRAAYQPKHAGGVEAGKELSQKQILELLSGDVPSSRVAMLVGERGIDFKPTSDYLKTLESAGAESDLLDALRAVKPPQVSLGTAPKEVSQGSAINKSLPDNSTNDATQTEVKQHLMRGLQLRKRRQLPEAEQEYRAATNLEPKNPDLWVGLSTILYHEGKASDAIAAAHQALLLNPNFDRAHVAMGNGLDGNKDYDGAAAEFRAAVRLNPFNDVAHDNLGRSLSRKGDLDGGVAEYHKALRLNPRNDHAHNNLGVALRKKGDLDGAIVEYHEALRLNRNNDLAHMNLGFALVQKGELRLALEQYRMGCELKPENQAYRQAYEKLQQRLRK
jgi:Flp pilus assembly protein TadD